MSKNFLTEHINKTVNESGNESLKNLWGGLDEETKDIVGSLAFLKALYNCAINEDEEDEIRECQVQQTKFKEISSLNELNGVDNGKFRIHIENSQVSTYKKLLKIYCTFDGFKKGADVVYSAYYTDNNDSQKNLLKDLENFGFYYKLKEEKESIIAYKDIETGKIIGRIKHKNKQPIEATLGKYKYFNLADVYKYCNKDIDKFNEEIKKIGGIEIF